MKKILDISVVVIALFVAIGCSTAPIEEAVPTKNSITASFADSRTALSDGVKTVWSAGDKIEVNGVTFALTSGAGEAVAVFTSSQPVGAAQSYTATYPAGVTSVPIVQNAVAGSFDPNAALASATSTSLNSMLFEHKHALLKFSVTADAQKVEVMGYTLSGDLKAGNSYYLAIAAGEYVGVTAKVDGVMVNQKKETFTAVNGKIYDLGLLGAEADIYAAMVWNTDTTITVGWTTQRSNVEYIAQVEPSSAANYAADITKEYKVALYSDAACSNLVVSASPIKTNMVDNEELYNEKTAPPRFIFTNLTPNTTYYAVIENLTDGTTTLKPLQVATAQSVVNTSAVVKSNAKAGDLILFENFGKIIYAGDMTSRGAGLSRSDRGSLTSYSGADCKGAITVSSKGYYMVGSGVEIGLFSTLKGLLDDMGLQDWGWIGGKSGANGGSVCARPGYVKIGTTANRAFICTPTLTAIPANKLATVEVVFKAAAYGSTSTSTVNEAERYMAVKALSKATADSSLAITYSTVVSGQNITLLSEKLSDWREYKVTLTDVSSDCSIALGGALGATTTNRMLLDDVRIYVKSLSDKPEDVAYGRITYSDGTPAAGVSVSDGYSVVQTSNDGSYTIKPHKDCWYIYYSVPADCQVTTNDYGQPCFFTRYNGVGAYNFTLTKLASGKESRFSLFCLADPQCKDNSETDNKGRRHGDRFSNESIPAIKSHAQTKSWPSYGTTLGDVVYSEAGRNNEAFMDDMRDKMAVSKSGMPIFQVMGNHDYTYFHTNKPINADATSSTYNIKAQRAFETVFGPINYSWNRGDAHIIGMRTMQWSNNTEWNSYQTTFTDEQVEWLRQDLAVVPKDKLVILCVHIPLLNSSNANIQKVISMIKQYQQAHIMSGHTHYSRNEPTLSGGVYEHVHGAVCGQWWWSNMNGDGTPNGYGVYDIEGNKIVNWYYMGVNKGMNDRDYQMRLYRGDIKGGKSSKSFNMQLGHDVILANIFNADTSWIVEVYEDGVYSGRMSRIAQKKYNADALGSYPCLVPTDSSQDWWSIGYHIGVVGRGKNSSYSNACYHMYKYKLRNANATNIRVEATDRFGRKYTCSEITGDYDYTLMSY